MFGLVTLFAIGFAVTATAHEVTSRERSNKKDIKLFTIQINKEVQQMDKQEIKGVKFLTTIVERALAVKQFIKKKKEVISQGELGKRLRVELVHEFQKHGLKYPGNLKNASAEEKKAIKKFEAGWKLIGKASIEDLKILIHTIKSAVAKREYNVRTNKFATLEKRIIPSRDQIVAFDSKSEIKFNH